MTKHVLGRSMLLEAHVKLAASVFHGFFKRNLDQFLGPFERGLLPERVRAMLNAEVERHGYGRTLSDYLAEYREKKGVVELPGGRRLFRLPPDIEDAP